MGGFAAGILKGFSASRDARVAGKKADLQAQQQTEMLKAIASGKAQPAQAIGGTPVDSEGKDIKEDEGPAPFGVAPKQPMTLGGRIKGGLKKMIGLREGGKITKTGLAYVHKGETVLPASMERKTMRKSVRKTGRR